MEAGLRPQPATSSRSLGARATADASTANPPSSIHPPLTDRIREDCFHFGRARRRLWLPAGGEWFSLPSQSFRSAALPPALSGRKEDISLFSRAEFSKSHSPASSFPRPDR